MESFSYRLPPALSVSERIAFSARRPFEREAIALLALLANTDPLDIGACAQREVDPGTWDWHIIRSWGDHRYGLETTSRPIEGPDGVHGEDTTYVFKGLPGRLEAQGMSTLDMRLGGSLTIDVSGCDAWLATTIRARFGAISRQAEKGPPDDRLLEPPRR
ncbi:MAG TPA: hypothetical protein PKD27_00750 [Tepidiformaceae bacterium]|nr:hypothetical protein [Tepidiformaceae bacterium]